MPESCPPAGQPAPEVALIGCGAIVELAHAPALAVLPVRVRAVVDTVRERRDLLAARFGVAGCARFESVPELTAKLRDPVLAIVALPTPAVPAAIGELTSAGLPILAEKPVATSRAELRAVAGADVRVVHNYLHRADVSQAVRLVRAGAVGTPRFIRLEQPDPGHFPGRGANPDWRRQGKGGCLLDNAYHWIYVGEALAGAPVRSVCAQLSAPATACAEDLALLLLRHGNDVLTSVQASWCARDAAGVLEIHGTAGSLRLVDRRCLLTGSDGQTREVPAQGSGESSYVALYREVVAGAARGERYGAPLSECGHVLAVLDAAYQSAITQTTAEVDG